MDVKKVFTVTNDETLVSSIQRALGKDYELIPFTSVATAAENLDLLSPQFVVMHFNWEDWRPAAEQFAETAMSQPDPPVLLAIAEDFNPVHQLSLLKLGFTEALARPLDIDRLRFLITCNSTGLRRPYTQVRKGRDQTPSLAIAEDNVVSCHSPQMRHAFRIAAKVAKRDSPVLLRGETGTGKTLLARLIHKSSSRHPHPFIDINCGALPEQLVESELFGHGKGAFTGADSDHVGRFGSVGRGTLFLDEVDTLPAGTQAKLLRALDQKRFESVGCNTSQKLEARVIAASNAPLEELVRKHLFRQDLYYRLNVVPIVLPPLRECRDDIVPLVKCHVARLAREFDQAIPEIDPRLAAELRKMEWPGNIRELINTVEQMMVLAEGTVLTLDDLPVDAGCAARQITLTESITENPLEAARNAGELTELVRVLDSVHDNRSMAAKILGISRVSLYKKLHKYGLVSRRGNIVAK